MNRTFRCCALLLGHTCSLPATQLPYQALVIHPVIDLVAKPLAPEEGDSAEALYRQLPIAGVVRINNCPRMHQALLHEEVAVVQERGDEIKIRISNFFFEEANSSIKQDEFWTLKRNVIPIESLEAKGVQRSQLPPPIQYQANKSDDKHVITLTLPYHDPATDQLLSAGTRFAKATVEDDYQMGVHIFDQKKGTLVTTLLPKNITVCTAQLSRQQKMNLYVQLCQQWAYLQDGFIPYVWGGYSVTRLCKQDSFDMHQTQDHTGTTISFFERADAQAPYGGLDCSGLVGRAAQAAGLPYYLKDTTTLAKHLAPYTESTALQNGDLIWFFGHVMVIGTVKKSTIIEARHYRAGYGKVHEIPVSQVFKGIKTFAQLKQAFLNGKSLHLLNKEGQVSQIIDQFKLLQMSSIF